MIASAMSNELRRGIYIQGHICLNIAASLKPIGMVGRIIRGQIIGFRKEGRHDAMHADATKIILEIAVEPLRDATLWAFVAAEPEVAISFVDELEQDR